MSASRNARLLVVGTADAVLQALRAHCAPEDLAVREDAAAALAFLSANAAALPRLIALDDSAGDVAAMVPAFRRDALTRTVPLLVLCKSATPETIRSLYDGGANACVIKPADAEALRETVAALTGFWLGANEVPPAPA